MTSPASNPVLTYGRMIKFSHSIFAMPFALSAAVLASRTHPVTATQVALIVGCMVTARSCAMGVNRIVDRAYDAKNPRTAIREIPSGQISLNTARALATTAAILFIVLAALLNPLCGALSPIALAIICGYSYAKRYTAFVHLWLGVSLGIAPVAVWIALTGSVATVALILAGAVATWVAGFDILYSLQDEGFDRGEGLHSIPVALGQKGAMLTSALLHVATIGLLAIIPHFSTLGLGYWAGFAVITGVLTYEHAIVKPGDLSRIDKAFFDLNGYVSLLFFAGVCAGTWVG